MLSLEQLSQMVKEHLGLHYIDSIQYTCKWAIGESPLGGRGLIATEDIAPGEVLFVDHPIVSGPRAGTSLPRGCTVCCVLDCDTFFKCLKCGLLLCSKDCQNTTQHFDDCNIISRWNTKVPIEEVDDTLLSRGLTAIRALLINEDQRNLMASLQANMAPQHGSEIRQLNEFFEIPEEDMHLMTLACCALDTNAYQIATTFGKNEMSKRGLYPVSGLMNHSCVSNTRHCFNNDLQMTVKAVKPIRAGSEIFSCYSGSLWGTPARRTHLYKTKHFLCKCDRCADPTERGTFLAALKCFATECPGVLLPIEPLKLTSAWKCLQCELRVPYNNICALQGALGSLMGTLNFENVGELEYFLLNRIIKYIPKTNQIVVDLQCRLIWIFGDTEGYRWHVRHVNWLYKTDEIYGFQSLFSYRVMSIDVWDSGRQSAAKHCWKHPTAVTKTDMDRLDLNSQLIEDNMSQNQRNWIIKDSILGGRGLFAKDRIKRGTLIFENEALAIGPRADTTDENFCISCFQIRDCNKCVKCMLLICSEECELSLHHSQVCDYITKNWSLKPNRGLNSGHLGSALIYLRFLLLDENKKAMLHMYQKCSASNISELDILLSNFDIPEGDIKFMSVVNSIIKINSFRIANKTQVKLIPLRGVFPLSSFLNHSCAPNTRNVFKSFSTMAVYATKDIEDGEEILTCYTGLLWSTPARRFQLYKSKGFWCNCERCLDRSEMGTKVSALKCLDTECVGVLLPDSATDSETSWSCDNCYEEVPAEKIRIVQSAVGSLLGTLDLDDQFRLETVVLERLAKFVPYCNQVFVDLRLRLSLRIGFNGLKLNGIPSSYININVVAAISPNYC